MIGEDTRETVRERERVQTSRLEVTVNLPSIRFLRSGVGFHNAGFKVSDLSGFRFRVPRFWFQVSDFGSRVSGLICLVSVFGFLVSGVGSQASVPEFRVSGVGSQDSGSGFRASGLGVDHAAVDSSILSVPGTSIARELLSSGPSSPVSPCNSGFGFRISGSRFRDSSLRFRVPGSGFGFRVSGFGFRVSGFGFEFQI